MTQTIEHHLVGEQIWVDGREGICVEAKATGSVIVDHEGKEWPGIKFKVKPADGGRAFWTVTFPNEERSC